jgi:hypothetical protein
MAITRRKLFNYLIPSSIATLISSKKAFSSNEPDLVNSLKNQSSNMKIEESFKKIDSRLDDIEKRVFKSKFDNSSKFNIPTDYPGLQEAIDDLYSKTLGTKEYVVINIESGFQLSSGLKVEHGDFSRFYLQSDDHIVEVADNFVGVFGPDGKKTITDGTVILAYHARGPVLGCIIDGRHIARTLYFALGGSNGWSDRLMSSTEEAPNKVKISGGINFRHSTFEAQEGSVIVCENVLATGCLLNSIYCERNSTVHAEFSDASGSLKAGVMATRGSRVNADSMNVSECQFGMWASRGAVISAADSKANNCRAYGYYADMAAIINAHNSSALNTGTGKAQKIGAMFNIGAAYHAYRGSKINACNSKASGSIYGISAITDSDISAYGITANSCEYIGANARFSSRIALDKCTILNSTRQAIVASDGSTISATRCNVNGGTVLIYANTGACITASRGNIKNGVSGLYAETGGRIVANEAIVTGNEKFDIEINTGSFITINASKYSKINNALNTLTADGVIFG